MEWDVGRNRTTSVKDPVAPGAKDIVTEKDGRKSAHESRDKNGRQRNLKEPAPITRAAM